MGPRRTQQNESQRFGTAAKAGVHVTGTSWIPAFAGMT